MQPAWELLQQVAGLFALEEREVAKDVDGVALVDCAAPEVGLLGVVVIEFTVAVTVSENGRLGECLRMLE